MLRKVKQLFSNFEAERWENLSNLRLAKESVAYKKTLVYLKSILKIVDATITISKPMSKSVFVSIPPHVKPYKIA